MKDGSTEVAGKRDVSGLHVMTAVEPSTYPGLSSNSHRVTSVIATGGGSKEES